MIEAPWDKVRDLLDSALELPREERSKYLDEHCSDPEVRRSVEALIESYEESATFLDKPAIPRFIQPEGSWAGRILEPYRLLNQIGEGGMGVVYRATRGDDEYRQNVAVKIVSGAFVTKQVVDHFRSERQILANLNHPNVARLLDGGTTAEGLPYLVMELVEGTPIDEYCDTRHLSARERLKLFMQLCGAVQYAHQNLIVHRDLKPGNILVTAEGVPKLLDFGIAKILDPVGQPLAERTMTLQPMMTPEYASPEQLEGRSVTTASDVYSLGVILYRLLTGCRRYVKTSKSARDLAVAIATEPPVKPSAVIGRAERGDSRDEEATIATIVNNRRVQSVERLRKELEGDLDAIVLKSLERDVARRYSSAEQFAEDIRRHLAGQPVEARLPTVGYRAAKFMRRHVVAVAVATAIAIASIIAVGLIVRAERIADRQRVRAEKRFNDVRSLANSLIFEIHDGIRDLPGSTRVRRLLIEKALKYVDSLQSESSGDRPLQRELATAYERLGDVQGYAYRSNMGDTEGAKRSYRTALSIREGLVKTDPGDSAAKIDLAESYDKLGSILAETAQSAAALETYRKSLALRQLAVRGNLRSEEQDYSLGSSHDEIGDVLAELGNTQEALGEFKKGISIFTSLASNRPECSKCRRMEAMTNLKIGFVYETMGRTPEALQEYSSGMTLVKALSSVDPSNALFRRDLAMVYANIGDVMAEQGNLAGARERYHQAIEIDEALSTSDPADVRLRVDLCLYYKRLGKVILITGDVRSALQYYRKALTLAEARITTAPENADARISLAGAYYKFGELYEIMANKPGMRLSAQRQYWTDAHLWLTKSQRVFVEMGKERTLTSSEAKQMRELRQEITRCDLALGH